MREIGGILKDDWWVGFGEWFEGEKNEIINRRNTIINIKALEGNRLEEHSRKVTDRGPRK